MILKSGKKKKPILGKKVAKIKDRAEKRRIHGAKKNIGSCIFLKILKIGFIAALVSAFTSKEKKTE